MTTLCSNIINYNNSNNIYTLQHHNTSIKLGADRPTDRPTDIATYRAAVAAKNENTNKKKDKKKDYKRAKANMKK